MSTVTSPVGSGVLSTLKTKVQNMKEELEKYKDLYEDKCHEVAVLHERHDVDENEIQSLHRKTQLLEDKCEQLEMRLQTSLNKLHEASKVVDEFERTQRTLENRLAMDDEKIVLLEQQLKNVKWVAGETERKFDEVARRLVLTESELERTEEKAKAAEAKARSLDSDLFLVSNNLKSLEISEQTLTQREEQFEMQGYELNVRLRKAEQKIEFLTHELKCKQLDLARSEQRLLESEMQCKSLQHNLEVCFRDIGNM